MRALWVTPAARKENKNMKTLAELKTKLETLEELGFTCVCHAHNTDEFTIQITFPKNCVCRQWDELTKRDTNPTFTIDNVPQWFDWRENGLEKAHQYVDEVTERYNNMYSRIMSIRTLCGEYHG